MEKFAIGVLVGGALGALLVANNNRMRSVVKKAQDEAQTKLNAFIDEKMRAVEKGLDKAKDKAEETAAEVKEKVSKKAKKTGTA